VELIHKDGSVRRPGHEGRPDGKGGYGNAGKRTLGTGR
jgi:hypothetical protein